MRGHPTISPIYSRGECGHARDPEAAFARVWSKCRDLWVEVGTIAVRPDELPDDLRAALVAWADETYGRRRGGRK